MLSISIKIPNLKEVPTNHAEHTRKELERMLTAEHTRQELMRMLSKRISS
jgi:hypothetical protein